MNPSPTDFICELFEELLASARKPERGKLEQSTQLPRLGGQPTNSFVPKLGLRTPATERVESILLERACWHLQSINQFVSLTHSDIARMRSAILGWLGDVEKTLPTDKPPAERAQIPLPANQHLLDTINSLSQLQAARTIVSEQYSVETQLEVLHIDPSTLLDPVLDLGCGHEGALVKWLRQRKTNAVGLDRFADSASGCLKADWLQFPLPPNQFGTVLAHLSFSLHFLHQHLRADGDAKVYATAYMAILRSLRISGRFIYAPGLPFIEQLLPSSQYKVARYPIPEIPLDERGAAVFEQALGESPLYAAHVTRV